jgi:hypothetical protein
MVAITVSIIATTAAAMPWGDAQDPPVEEDAATSPPRRVILLVGRSTEVAGTVVTEDEEAIVLRTVHGLPERHLKSRIREIVELVDPGQGQPGTVVLRSGHRRYGTILKDDFDGVTMHIKGIDAFLPRSSVSHVLLQPELAARYAKLKKELDPRDLQQHLRIAQWLLDERRYDWAHEELTELLTQHDSAEAIQLLRIVIAQQSLGDETTTDDPPTDDTQRPTLPAEILTDEDVNIIRVYEIDFDHPPPVEVAPRAIRTLIDTHGDSGLMPATPQGQAALFREDPLEIVKLIFAIRAHDLYPLITVKSDPYAMRLFKERVHDAWLLQSCASNRCHGGTGAGRFFLHRKNFKDTNVRYTNFLILDRLDLGNDRALIDYEHPEESLLIQYALPQSQARRPHPPIRGWRPVFTPTRASLKDDAIEWINAMMPPPRPSYPVEYAPPVVAEPPSKGDPDPTDQDRLPR